MLHAILCVRSKCGAAGQCVFALDKMLDSNNMETVYELDLFHRGVPLRMGREEFSEQSQKKRKSRLHSRNVESDQYSSDDEDALFEDCAGEGVRTQSPEEPDASSAEEQSNSRQQSTSPPKSPRSDKRPASSTEPPPMKPVVFPNLTPSEAVLKPRILAKFRCRICLDDFSQKPPPVPPAAAKPKR